MTRLESVAGTPIYSKLISEVNFVKSSRFVVNADLLAVFTHPRRTENRPALNPRSDLFSGGNSVVVVGVQSNTSLKYDQISLLYKVGTGTAVPGASPILIITIFILGITLMICPFFPTAAYMSDGACGTNEKLKTVCKPGTMKLSFPLI